MFAWYFHSRSHLCHQVKQSQEWKLGVLASTTAPWQVELVLLSTCIVVYLCCCLLVLSSTCIVIYLCCCLSFVFFEFSSVCGWRPTLPLRSEAPQTWNSESPTTWNSESPTTWNSEVELVMNEDREKVAWLIARLESRLLFVLCTFFCTFSFQHFHVDKSVDGM